MVPRTPNILVVDDEFAVRDSLASWLRKDGYEVTAAADASAALSALQAHSFDLAVLDIKIPGLDGMDLQEHIQRIDPGMAVIVITAFATVDSAVRALKQGAFDYVAKPIAPEELSHLVVRALEKRRLEQENQQLRVAIDELVSVDKIVGDSPAMCRVMELIEHVAKTDATVLILGESGTGKELIARAIHANSKRRYCPIVPVNCGALPQDLLESELFGHEKGAFTGATQRRKGRIELAHCGTLFLDEVGAIDPKMQVELLRVLETKELTRVGGVQTVHVDFRVICATNSNLERTVAEGRFREDLFYRINVFMIEAPPLRARRSDIPLLSRHFVDKFARQMDKRITQIQPEAMEVLTNYNWPGNVRELSNAIERAMVLGQPPAIRPEDLPLRGTSEPDSQVLGASLADVEKRYIASVLNGTQGNVTRAAEILGVDRVTVYNKIKKYGLRD